MGRKSEVRGREGRWSALSDVGKRGRESKRRERTINNAETEPPEESDHEEDGHGIKAREGKGGRPRVMVREVDRPK